MKLSQLNISLPWTMLRAIGNSSAVKLTIVIPLVGYLIIFNENILHYIELSRELLGGYVAPLPDAATGVAAHVSWRLLCLYFGLCLIAVASALHQLFCPQEIKSYASPTEYISQEQDHMSELHFHRIEHELDSNPHSVEELTVLKQYAKVGPSPDTVEELRRRHHAHQREVMDLQFRTLDSCRPWARWTAGLLYAGGFLALAVPSVQVFARVVVLLVGTIVS